ncbi:MAG: outer membrane lipoprotein carrier protein LolA [Candidatus Aminicenantia bacterium]
MKKTSIFIMLVLGLIVGPFAFSQTVDEIIDKNLETKGGLEKIKAIQSVKITGKVIAQGVEMPMVMWNKRPNMIRMETTFQDKKIVQAYDGEKAWWIMPFLGSEDPQEMTGLQAEAMKDQADFDGPLVDYKEKGHKVELLGKEDMAGTEVYKLKVTKKDGKEIYYYLDTEYCIELKQSMQREYQGTELQVETILADYKPVKGIMIPHSIETRVNGQTQAQITIESVEFDVDIDDSLFKMPPKNEKTQTQPTEKS